jgi:biotin-[acetyl-CoA-carboxylase] ligase BirA-like protein
MTLAKDFRDKAVVKPSVSAESSKGFLVMADEQTQGVGRRGRDWVSQAADNLYFSFVFALPAEVDTTAFLKEALKLNFAIGVATVEACAAVGLSTARVKWPNDVWVQGKKVSGMLVDVDPRSRSAVAGVGINVNQVRLSRGGGGEWGGAHERVGMRVNVARMREWNRSGRDFVMKTARSRDLFSHLACMVVFHLHT